MSLKMKHDRTNPRLVFISENKLSLKFSGSGVQTQRSKQYGINIVYRFFRRKKKKDRVIRMPTVTESGESDGYRVG